MDVADLLSVCRARRVELAAAGGDLRVRAPAGAVDDHLRDHLRRLKPELLAIIATACPRCGCPVDDRRRCWSCHDRSCAGCGRPTGSAFLSVCLVCDLAESARTT